MVIISMLHVIKTSPKYKKTMKTLAKPRTKSVFKVTTLEIMSIVDNTNTVKSQKNAVYKPKISNKPAIHD